MTMFETRPVESLRPPYVYYNTVRKFLESYRNHNMPENIKDMIAEFSETTRHHLRSTLRSLRLSDENNQATELLRRLASASEADFPAILQEVLYGAYPYLFGAGAHGFDMATASRQEVAEKFRSIGLTSASTIQRSVDFIRQASKEAGIITDTVKRNGVLRPDASTDATTLDKPNKTVGERNHAEGADIPPLPPPVAQNGLPPLPTFDTSWSKQAQEMWLEMRFLEVKSGK